MCTLKKIGSMLENFLGIFGQFPWNVLVYFEVILFLLKQMRQKIVFHSIGLMKIFITNCPNIKSLVTSCNGSNFTYFAVL